MLIKFSWAFGFCEIQRSSSFSFFMSVELQIQSIISPTEKEGGQVQAIFRVNLIALPSEEDKGSFINFLTNLLNLSFMSSHCCFCMPSLEKPNSVFKIAPP